MKQPASSGITLVEMLVLTITLCVLSISAVLLLSQYRERTRNAIRLNDLASLEDAITLYQSDRGDSLVPGDASVESFSALLVPAYLPVLPEDPGMNSYAYLRNSSKKNEFVLGAFDEANSTNDTPVFFREGSSTLPLNRASVDGNPATHPESGIEFGFRDD